MLNIMMRPLIQVIDFIFPSRCVNCGRAVSIINNCVCGACLNNIQAIENSCGVCSGSLFDSKCGICSDRKFYIQKNITVSEYSGVTKNILQNYKFKKQRRLHIHLAKAALLEIKNYHNLFDIITSVPMNRIKKWERGFNQSELIAKWLSETLNKPYLPLLKEKSHYKTQKTLSYRERFLNILDRYKILNIKKIIGKNILIIDDVFTTGATINECARIIKSFGGANVYSLTIARADIKRVELN